MGEIHNDEWLQAILDHPETIDTDLHVAVGMLLNGTANGATFLCADCGQWELIDQDDIDESVTVLAELGFVELVAAVECDGGEDRLLVLRMPVSA
jgi:hypothetical protein